MTTPKFIMPRKNLSYRDAQIFTTSFNLHLRSSAPKSKSFRANWYLASSSAVCNGENNVWATRDNADATGTLISTLQEETKCWPYNPKTSFTSAWLWDNIDGVEQFYWCNWQRLMASPSAVPGIGGGGGGHDLTDMRLVEGQERWRLMEPLNWMMILGNLSHVSK